MLVCYKLLNLHLLTYNYESNDRTTNNQKRQSLQIQDTQTELQDNCVKTGNLRDIE